MNGFDSVNLNAVERQADNTRDYGRVLVSVKNFDDIKSLNVNEDDIKALKDDLKGEGKLVAFGVVRKTYGNNKKYIVFLEQNNGIVLYLYTRLNGLYNKMGPYKDLETAEANADSYGLFQEGVSTQSPYSAKVDMIKFEEETGYEFINQDVLRENN